MLLHAKNTDLRVRRMQNRVHRQHGDDRQHFISAQHSQQTVFSPPKWENDQTQKTTSA